MALDGYYVKKIGQNRGAPRVWLDRLQTEGAGFSPGHKYDITVQGKTICLTANKDGSRVVSSKKDGDRVNPVIDLNSKELLAMFDGMAAVRVVVKKGEIYLVPLATELKKQERSQRLRAKLESGEALSMGSLSHGGGILSHAIHTGLQSAGHNVKLAFVNDIDESLLEHASIHNDAWSEDTKVYAAPMQEIAFDSKGLATLPAIELIEIGIPCQGASLSGRAKVGHGTPEAHPEVGHLVVSALIILSKTNPAVCLIENVPMYASTASAAILRTQLKELGYVTSERILSGKDWGTIENRNRWVMIAVTEGIEFDFDRLMPPILKGKKLGDVLDDVPDGDSRWNKQEGLKRKNVRDAAEGKGFKMQLVSEESEHVGTIGAGYAKRRSTEPFIVNKSDPELLRLLTVEEHARVKDVPEHLVEGLSLTQGHQILGQGIVYPPFRDIGQHIGNALNRYAGKPEILSEIARQVPAVADEEFSAEFLDLAKEVVATFKRAEDGRTYVGAIVAADRNLVIQDAGRGVGIVHDISKLDRVPKLGASLKIVYEKGQGKVVEPTKHQLALSL